MKMNFDKIQAHNKEVMSGGHMTETKEIKESVQTFYQEQFPDLVKQILKTRKGLSQDQYGRKLPAYDISFNQALIFTYGVDLKTYLKQREVFTGSDTLSTAARRFGNDNLTLASLEGALIQHSQFDGLNNTGDISSEWRFIIPELILSAIRIDYEGMSYHNNWIATTQTIANKEVTMPNIIRGNAVPRKIGEAESIPFGTVKFQQKKTKVSKIGIGFKITDELIEESSIDMLFTFLGEVGIDMSIGTDSEALNVLINGEQSDLSENAPVIGVDTVSSLVYKDIRRPFARMERLKRPATRILYGEEDGLDISVLEQFRGFAGGTKQGTISGIMGKIMSLTEDIFVMPANQIMLLSSSRCMVKFKYKGMKIEQRRNPQNQETELFVSDFIGFAIIRRDARVIVDKSLAFASNGFPAYMDIDARIAETFKNIQGS